MGPRSPKKVIPTKMGRPRVAHTPFSPEHRGAAQSQTYADQPLSGFGRITEFPTLGRRRRLAPLCLQNPSTT